MHHLSRFSKQTISKQFKESELSRSVEIGIKPKFSQINATAKCILIWSLTQVKTLKY